MSEHKEQKKIKPKIEDRITKCFAGEKAKNALDFVAWLRENKLSPGWSGTDGWNIRFKGKSLGTIGFYNGMWRFAIGFSTYRFLHEYYNMEECELKSFVFDHIYTKQCGHHDGCQWNPNAEKVEYMVPTECGCWPMRIFDAEGETLENMKKLIEYNKDCIQKNIV